MNLKGKWLAIYSKAITNGNVNSVFIRFTLRQAASEYKITLISQLLHLASSSYETFSKTLFKFIAFFSKSNKYFKKLIKHIEDNQEKSKK